MAPIFDKEFFRGQYSVHMPWHFQSLDLDCGHTKLKMSMVFTNILLSIQNELKFEETYQRIN